MIHLRPTPTEHTKAAYPQRRESKLPLAANNDSRHSNTQTIVLTRTRARIVYHGPTFA